MAHISYTAPYTIHTHQLKTADRWIVFISSQYNALLGNLWSWHSSIILIEWLILCLSVMHLQKAIKSKMKFILSNPKITKNTQTFLFRNSFIPTSSITHLPVVTVLNWAHKDFMYDCVIVIFNLNRISNFYLLINVLFLILCINM